jgi:hypothetical protein
MHTLDKALQSGFKLLCIELWTPISTLFAFVEETKKSAALKIRIKGAD